VKGKIIVCRCEDVTLHDVEHSIELGYADIEEVKRFTGFGTGPCQGKECMALIARIVAERAGVEAASVPAFTSRPPIAPTPLRLFARDPAGDPDDGAGSEER